MNTMRGIIKFILSFLFYSAILLLTACGGNQVAVEATIVPTSTATAQVDLPTITSVEADRDEVPRYESVELTLEVDAEYSNPYDVRNISLDAAFTSPDGKDMAIPGF